MDNLLLQLTGKYTKEDLEALKALNDFLTIPYFDDDIAIKIGNQIIKQAKAYGDIVIEITSCLNQQVLFQYIGPTKGTRNLGFIEKKRNVVLKCGYCSLYPLVANLVTGEYEEMMHDTTCLPVAGCFPLFVEDEMIATIGVSGLHEGNDFKVVIESLEKLYAKKAPKISGPII